MQKSGSQKGRRPQTRQVGELVQAIVDPVLARKAGMNLSLLAAWPDLVGPRLAGVTRPEKLNWPPRRYEDEAFKPATLVVACEGAHVLRLQHESGELLQRLNAFFGFFAVEKLRITQQAVAQHRESRKPAWRPPDAAQQREIASAVSGIENERLKAALTRYGECVLGRNRSRSV